MTSKLYHTAEYNSHHKTWFSQKAIYSNKTVKLNFTNQLSMFLKEFNITLKDILSSHSENFNVNYEMFIEIKNDVFRLLLENDLDFNLTTIMMDEFEELLFPSATRNIRTNMDAITNAIYELLENNLGKKYSQDLMFEKTCKIVLLLGLKGSGKTKFIAKIANKYSNDGYKVGILDLGDQSYLWPEIFDDENIIISKCEKKRFMGREIKKKIKILKEKGVHFILVKASGSINSDRDFIKSIKSIIKHVKPDDVFLSLDGTLGQSNNIILNFFSVNGVKFAGCLISKLDVVKSRTLSNLVAATSYDISIAYLGYGEGVHDIVNYDPHSLLYDKTS